MPTYKTPGVYIEEIASGARPIEAVSTSVTAFLGIAPNDDVSVGQATKVASYADFERHFGGTPHRGNTLANAVAGFFMNGGTLCYVINLGAGVVSVGQDMLAALDHLDEINLIAAPGFVDDDSYQALTTHCDLRGDRMAILDAPLGFSYDPSIDPIAQSEHGFGALYTPWIKIRDAISGDAIYQPPSGHIAGLFAQTDALRGVHVSPANVILNGALGLNQDYPSDEITAMAASGVNAIKTFPNGIKVWGARTIAPSWSQWRYVPVRRLMMMIRRSIQLGTAWSVFEPHDETLWTSVSRDVTGFLHGIWREGALAGAKPDEAFYARCDRTTMSQSDIDRGQLILEIGVAP
ncbi:MAG: phage tail sheath subtilisin-like domain-containing protein, partial [Pseudomonadota bacterium]